MTLLDWDPADTDGVSEDWLPRLLEVTRSSGVARTPFGLAVTRAEDVQALANDPSLKVPVVEQYELLGVSGPMLHRAKRVILGLDGEPHHRLRSLVNRAFTPRAVERLAEGMRSHLENVLSSAHGATLDFLNVVVGGYPAAVIGDVLGVPEKDLPRLAELADAITSAQFSLDATTIEPLTAAALECDAYLRKLIAAKRQEPGDDILSHLTRLEVDGDRLDDEEIVSISSSVLNAGIDTTRHQSCLAMTLFAEYPEQWTALRDDPSLIPNAVEEILRFRPVTPLLTRLCRRPIRVAESDVDAGTIVSLAAAAANRDPSFNSGDVNEFDIGRESPRHLTFGFGAHYCLGAALARRELAELLRVMGENFSAIEIIGPVPRRPVMGVYGVRALTIAAP
jgi:cytochrome P450